MEAAHCTFNCPDLVMTYISQGRYGNDDADNDVFFGGRITRIDVLSGIRHHETSLLLFFMCVSTFCVSLLCAGILPWHLPHHIIFKATFKWPWWSPAGQGFHLFTETGNRWTQFCSNIHGSLTMYSNVFDPLNFHLVPSSGQHFNLSSTLFFATPTFPWASAALCVSANEQMLRLLLSACYNMLAFH